MSQTVKVHFFGEFRLESGTASLNEETIHSKKVMKLMAYLLLNHDRMDLWNQAALRLFRCALRNRLPARDLGLRFLLV